MLLCFSVFTFANDSGVHGKDLGLCESESTLDMIPRRFSLVLAMTREILVLGFRVDVYFF